MFENKKSKTNATNRHVLPFKAHDGCQFWGTRSYVKQFIITGHSEGLEQKLVKYMSLAHDKRV